MVMSEIFGAGTDPDDLAIALACLLRERGKQVHLALRVKDGKTVAIDVVTKTRKTMPDGLNIERARKWLAGLQPLYTWAPLLRSAPSGAGYVRTRHAWPLPVFTGAAGTPGKMPSHTVCGIAAALPDNFSDTSDTPDCDACRNKAAEPLAILLEEAERRGLEQQAERASRAERKWQEYERDYILPCFKWAEESGLDLHEAVLKNPGKNCVEILVRWLQNQARIAKSFGETLDNIREALGQEATHHYVMADDIEELVKAVELCASDGGCRAMTVLKKLRERI